MEAVEKHPFPILISKNEYGKILDDKAFENTDFKEGDTVEISIGINNEKQSFIDKNKGYLKYNSIIYEIVINAMYTKEIKQKEDRFKMMFSFQKTGIISDSVYLNPDVDEKNMPFEVGDIIFVEIKRL